MGHNLLLWLDRMTAMTVKELKQLSRDPVMLLVIVYFFTVDVYMAGSGIQMDLKQAAFMVIDHDHSAASRDLIYRFRSPYFDFKGELSNQHEALKRLEQSDVLLVLDIPSQFQRDLMRGKSVSVQMQVDASNATLGTLASTYAGQIIARYSEEYAEKHLGLGEAQLQAVPMVLDQHRVYYNPNQYDPWFMSISELLTVITMLALMLPASAAVREKERGTIEQLAVSPLSSAQILFPKVLAMGLIILLGTAVTLFLIIVPVFNLPIKGSISLFFMVTAVYVFATSGLGLFIATLSRNLGQVVMLVLLIMMPLLLLSGSWTPPEAMPSYVRQAMYLSPLYYYIEISYAILLKGAGLKILWDSLIGLSLLGSLVFAFGVWRFRKQFG